LDLVLSGRESHVLDCARRHDRSERPAASPASLRRSPTAAAPNTTDHMRRVYVAQYSAEPILSEDGSRPRMLAEPLLVDGKRMS
jgi:hypothetical protein